MSGGKLNVGILVQGHKQHLEPNEGGGSSGSSLKEDDL